MPSRTRGRRFVSAIAIIVAIFAVLGHICVLPLHAHAITVDGHGSHDDDTADESVHTASCEGLKSARPMLSAAPAVATAMLTTPAPRPDALFSEDRTA